jgi:hypothetical protein
MLPVKSMVLGRTPSRRSFCVLRLGLALIAAIFSPQSRAEDAAAPLQLAQECSGDTFPHPFFLPAPEPSPASNRAAVFHRQTLPLLVRQISIPHSTHRLLQNRIPTSNEISRAL